MADRITLSRAKGWRKPDGAVIVSRPSIWGNPWGIGTPGTIDLVLGSIEGRWLTAIEITPVRAVGIFRDWLESGTICNGATPPHGQLTGDGERFMRDHLHGRRKLILSEIHTLRGRDLCCWCKIISPSGYVPCHADVLLSLANDIPMEEVIRENTRRAKGETL